MRVVGLMAKRPRAARLVALTQDGVKALLVKRRRDGLWAFPGGQTQGTNTVIRESSPLQICHEKRILLLLASYFDPVSALPFACFNRPAVIRLSRR